MKRTRKKHNAVIRSEGVAVAVGGTGRSPSWRVSSAFIRTGSTTGRSSCWTGRRAFSKATVARACWERGVSKRVVLLTGDRGFESISLQRRVQCEPDADDFLAAGGAVLAEPLADRAQHEMPAQPVLCKMLPKGPPTKVGPWGAWEEELR